MSEFEQFAKEHSAVERVKFEHTFFRHHLHKAKNGEYVHRSNQHLWEGWLARAFFEYNKN